MIHPNSLIYILYPTANCLKTIPFTVAHNFIAHLCQYLPPPPPPLSPGKQISSGTCALRASLAIYHLISNAYSWNNCSRRDFARNTGSRGDVFVVRTSTRHFYFVPRLPCGRRAVRQRRYGLRSFFQNGEQPSRSGSDKKRRNLLRSH